MDIQASIEQVAGILSRAELHFQTHQDGDSYRLLFGEEAVFIHFDQFGEHVRIYLTSPALQQLDPEDAGYAVLLNAVNDLNLSHRFAKWVINDETTLLGVHDLLGDSLQAGELLNAVYALASAADDTATRYADATGGIRYAAATGVFDEVEDDIEF
jgi:hypothetical protein